MMRKVEEAIEGEVVNGNREPNGGKDDRGGGTSGTRKWQRLANVLQNKSNIRLSSTEYLLGRASLMIATAAFLVPSILEQEMQVSIFLFSFVAVMASLVLMAVSIFTAPKVPIDPKGMINDLENDDRRSSPMSEKDFNVWLCKSYRDGLEGYDNNYAKNRKLQQRSIGLLIFAILLLFINKGVNMEKNYAQNNIPDPSVTIEKRSIERPSGPCPKNGIPKPSVETCLNEGRPRSKK